MQACNSTSYASSFADLDTDITDRSSAKAENSQRARGGEGRPRPIPFLLTTPTRRAFVNLPPHATSRWQKLHSITWSSRSATHRPKPPHREDHRQQLRKFCKAFDRNCACATCYGARGCGQGSDFQAVRFAWLGLAFRYATVRAAAGGRWGGSEFREFRSGGFFAAPRPDIR